MHIFYAPEIATKQELPAEEARHCTKVLRLTEGDCIQLTDGLGSFYQAQITLATPKKCLFEIISCSEQPMHTPYIHLAMGPTKNMDRNEWVAEKATEIGFNELSFINCRYSERKQIKEERIRKILVAAMKQSKHAFLPKLNTMTAFEQFISQPFSGEKFIAHCYQEEQKTLKELYTPGKDVLILIGPEGDFSPEEIQLALQYGFQPISLGESRLRTETAAIYACSTINVINQ